MAPKRERGKVPPDDVTTVAPFVVQTFDDAKEEALAELSAKGLPIYSVNEHGNVVNQFGNIFDTTNDLNRPSDTRETRKVTKNG